MTIDLKGVQEWYRYIPHFNSPDFPRFAASGVGVVRYLVGKDVPVFITRDKDASASHRGIAIPGWIFDPAQYPLFSLDWSGHEPVNVLSIALFDALLVHESAHLLYSPEDKDAALRAIHYTEEATEGLYFCLNLVEDVYGEHQEWPQYGVFLQPKADFALGPNKIDQLVETKQLLPLLNCWINPLMRDHPAFVPYPMHLMEQALEEHDPRARTRLAVEFYKLLPPAKDDTCPQKGLAIGAGYDETGMRVTEMSKEAAERLGAVARRIKNEDEFTKLPEAQIHDVEKYARGVGSCETDSRFKQFGRTLSLLKTRLPVPNIPDKRGPRLLPLQLSRFGTDGRVFGEYAEDKTQDETELVLLIDASGSMESIYEEVLSATKGIFESARQSRIRTVVLAHTADSGAQAHVITIVNGHHNIEHRFNKAASINLNENVDGMALLAAAKFFTKRRGRKVLVSLSDGEPCCPGYNGSSAVKHTMKSIQFLRDRGIIVLSVSLVASVVRDNNQIYGKKFNIPVENENYAAALKKAILEFT